MYYNQVEAEFWPELDHGGEQGYRIRPPRNRYAEMVTWG